MMERILHDAMPSTLARLKSRNFWVNAKELVHQLDSVPVQLAYLTDQGLGNGWIRFAAAAYQLYGAGRQLAVYGSTGELLGLTLSAVGKFRDQLSGTEHAVAHHAIAEGNGPGEQGFKFPQKVLRILGKVLVGGQEAQL